MIRGCVELMEALPYLIGFHPHESVVVVVLAPGQMRVDTVLRHGLDSLRNRPDHWRLMADHLAGHGAAAAVLVAYGGSADTADGLPEWSVVSAGIEALQRAGISVPDALYVTSERWWSYLCDDPSCCPAEGRPLPSGDPPPRLAALAARVGLAALPDRAALAASVEPVSSELRDAVRDLVERAESDLVDAVVAAGGIRRWRSLASSRVLRARSLFTSAVAAHPPSGHAAEPEPLSPAEVADLLVALLDPRVRDACWHEIEREPDLVWSRVWQFLARRAPETYAAEAYFLLGWTAWRRGDGPLACLAVERALLDDPEHGAATLLTDVLGRGLDPRRFPLLSGPDLAQLTGTEVRP